jgi:hypothetical protein
MRVSAVRCPGRTQSLADSPADSESFESEGVPSTRIQGYQL